MISSPYSGDSRHPGKRAVVAPIDLTENIIEACRNSAPSAASRKGYLASRASPQAARSGRTSARIATTEAPAQGESQSVSLSPPSHRGIRGARNVAKRSRSARSAAARIGRTASTPNVEHARLSTAATPRHVPAILRYIAIGGTRTAKGDARPTGDSATASMTSSSKRCSRNRVSSAQTRVVIRPLDSARRTLTTTAHVAPAGHRAESAFVGSSVPGAMSVSATSKMTRNASVASRSMSKGHEGDR